MNTLKNMLNRISRKCGPMSFNLNLEIIRWGLVLLMPLILFSSLFSQMEPAPEGYFRDPINNCVRKLDRPNLGFQGFSSSNLPEVQVSNLIEFKNAISSGNKHIILDPGITINTSEQHFLPSNIVITGNGSTIKGGASLTSPLLRIAGKTNVVIEKLNIEANNASQGIFIENSSNILIQEVNAFNAYHSNINFKSSVTQITIRYCTVYNANLWHGIETKDLGASNYSLYSNIAYGNGRHGFNMHATNGEFAGNLSYNNDYAGKFFDAVNVCIHHNHYHSNNEWDGAVGIGSSLNRPAKDLIFYANVVPGFGFWPASGQSASSYSGIQLCDNLATTGGGTPSISNQGVPLGSCDADSYQSYNCDGTGPSCTVGGPCDDGDSNTSNDMYDANCDCSGMPSINCSNVTLNKTVIASAEQVGNEGYKLTNGNVEGNSRWSAENYPQQATIDLGASYELDQATLYPFMERAYQYTIRVSCDNTNWTTVVDRANNTDGGSMIMDSFTAIDARYILLEVTGASGYSGPWVSINELEMCGSSSDGCDANDVESFFVDIKVFLQGPLEMSDQGGWMMRDDLRNKKLIPFTEPYSANSNFTHTYGGESFDQGLLDVLGENAIVDWIIVETRLSLDPAVIVATRAGLVQRDGNVVDIDGLSPLKFDLPADYYYIAIRHRNHLGIMTAESYYLTPDFINTIDFANPNSETYGNHAQANFGSTLAMWSGNANEDLNTVFQGNGNDPNSIFFDVLTQGNNANNESNYILEGYYSSDINLDGNVLYQGPNNDPSFIFFNILIHSENTGTSTGFIIHQQMPGY